MSLAYEKNELRKIQKCMTLALEEFDRICTELNLRYVVYSGTAIGAVRHKGFIPWDDDVDVCMPREDYDLFFKKAGTVIDDKFTVLDSSLDPDYPRPFGVLGFKDSVFIPGIAENRTYPMPLGIDVFPFDSIPSNEQQYKKKVRKTWVWGRLFYLLGTPKVTLDIKGPKRFLIDSALHTIHWSLRLGRVKPFTIYKNWLKAAELFNDSSSTWLGSFSEQDPKRWSAHMDEMFPASRVPFEDITVMLPKDYDSILTRQYGTYMEIPPEHEQVNHFASTVVYGPNVPL
ncbi:LicD family protein [Arcanobacterium phocae]|uniref:LicD family protein n=1 Tax=Arcanobacterium phocae TaxID=131112 RepID=UPI001C0EE3EA|nr:LicD family protein [Arcanobacterium phocae]